MQDHPGVRDRRELRTQAPGHRGGAFPWFPRAVLTLVKPLYSFSGTDVTDCHQPGGSKQQECNCLVPEAGSPNARCWQGRTSSKALGWTLSASSSLWRPWQSLACGCCSRISASVLPWPSLCLCVSSSTCLIYPCLALRTPVIRFSPLVPDQ